MTEICLHLVTENLFLQTIAAIELYCFTNTSIWFTTSYIGYSVERHQSRLGRFFFQINFCTTYTRNVMLFLHIAKKFISPSNFFRKTRCPWNKESCYVYIPITYKIWFHTNFWGLVKHQFHYINIVGVYSHIACYVHSNYVLVSPIIDSHPIGRQELSLQHGCTLAVITCNSPQYLINCHNKLKVKRPAISDCIATINIVTLYNPLKVYSLQHFHSP